LLSTPPYIAACLAIVLSAYISDKYKVRGYVNACNYFIAAMGFVILETTTTPAARYIGTFLCAMGAFPGIAITIAWNSNNIRGSPTKRAVGIALQSSAGSFGGVIGSFVYVPFIVKADFRYVSTDRPEYRAGHAVMIALNTLSFCCMFSILGVIDGSNLGDDLLVEACE
jgi:predicted MFS family arabinose efflux permease